MLRWIEPDEPLPALSDVARANHGADQTAPDADEAAVPAGLVAAGRDLSVERLIEAYSAGIFPWYEAGQPVLWWSPDPRMVLYTNELRVPRSLRKTMKRALDTNKLSITLDCHFEAVIRACAQIRHGQSGTWLTPEMQQAYTALHEHGLAHSVEVWQRDDGDQPRLVGGLYGVSLGRMFFGESMFTRVSDASKMALVALVQMLRSAGFDMIDCQQNTAHLARFGAREISREAFVAAVTRQIAKPPPDWSALRQALAD